MQFIPVFSLFALWRKAERGGAREQKCVVLEKERGGLCVRRNRRRRWKSDIHAEEEKRQTPRKDPKKRWYTQDKTKMF